MDHVDGRIVVEAGPIVRTPRDNSCTGTPDTVLLEPQTPPFSPLTMFVCTYVARLSNIACTHEELIEILQPSGDIKALNCNYGHKAQAGFEHFMKSPKQAPAIGRGRRDGRPAPVVVRQRKPQGDGTCFNSALEAIIQPGSDGLPPAMVEYLGQHPKKHYAIKSFPTTGQTQVPGTVCSNLEDGHFIVRLWAQYLTDSGVATDPSKPIGVVSEHPIMLNFKYFLYRNSDRIILNLPAIIEHLEAAKAGGAIAAGVRPPMPIREIKHVQDGQNISFKFMTPSGKKIRVNMFYRGKVNILGAADFERPREIYRYLSDLITEHWGAFVSIQPLPDRVRVAKPNPTPAAPRSTPPNLTIAVEHRLSDEDIDFLLGYIRPAGRVRGQAASDKNKVDTPQAAATVLDYDALIQMAQGFAEDFGDSSDAGEDDAWHSQGRSNNVPVDEEHC